MKKVERLGERDLGAYITPVKRKTSSYSLVYNPFGSKVDRRRRNPRSTVRKFITRNGKLSMPRVLHLVNQRKAVPQVQNGYHKAIGNKKPLKPHYCFL